MKSNRQNKQFLFRVTFTTRTHAHTYTHTHTFIMVNPLRWCNCQRIFLQCGRSWVLSPVGSKNYLQLISTHHHKVTANNGGLRDGVSCLCLNASKFQHLYCFSDLVTLKSNSVWLVQYIRDISIIPSKRIIRIYCFHHNS